MIFWRKFLLFYCCFSTLFAQLVVLSHGNEFGTNANSRQLERLATAEESTASVVDICSSCEEDSMKTIMHNCLLRCLSMLLADQSTRHYSSTSKSYSVDRVCSPHKCLKIIDRCANSNCGVQTFKTQGDILHHSSHDADPLEDNQRNGLGLHRLLKQSGDNSKRRSRRSSYLYRDLIIDDGAQAWLATEAERGQEKWMRMGDNRPGTEEVLSERLGKRGYNDISDLCMEFNCGEMAPGSIDYLKCVQDNRCA